MKKEWYAVLTGDLIGSSRLTGQQSADAMQWLREAAGKFANLYPHCVVGELDTFRHDSWQMLISNPALSFRVAVYLRTALKRQSDTSTRYDSRVSIGVGEIEMISESRISDSRGPAFTVSGKNLDSMGSSEMSFAVIPEKHSAFMMVGIAVTPLLDCVIREWTPAEARAVHGALERLTQEDIARSSPPNPQTNKPVTRQAIADSLDRACWTRVEKSLTFIETQSKL
ncbi:MAG: hypothetical protein RRA94_10410 [Bacteroidota bacterium]|nr:hypothetical protein [Bacteroidota bacterium]